MAVKKPTTTDDFNPTSVPDADPTVAPTAHIPQEAVEPDDGKPVSFTLPSGVKVTADKMTARRLGHK